MKKILPVVLVLVLVLALMIVPAFADEAPVTYEATLNEDIDQLTFEVVPPAGTYSLRFYSSDVDFIDATVSLSASDPPEGAEHLFSYSLTGSIFVNHYGADYEYIMAILVDAVVDSDYPDLRYNICSFAFISDGEQLPVPVVRAILTPISPAPDPDAALDDFLDVISGVGTWLITALTSVTALFYTAESGLTLLGVLCVVPLGLGLIFLLVFTIVNWLRFRS